MSGCNPDVEKAAQPAFADRSLKIQVCRAQVLAGGLMFGLAIDWVYI
jgi:hypothetical protein